jgi:hypothetical protein
LRIVLIEGERFLNGISRFRDLDAWAFYGVLNGG